MHWHRTSLEAIAPPKSLPELKDLLEACNVDIDRWNKGAAKRVEDLWSEVSQGESLLTKDDRDRLTRVVNVVGVDVMFRDRSHRALLHLVECKQVFRSGRERWRDLRTSLGEKKLPAEDPQQAAYRAVFEELGIPCSDLRLDYDGSELVTGDSQSYPGLWSIKELSFFSCWLPVHLFCEAGYEEHQSDKITQFAWQSVLSEKSGEVGAVCGEHKLGPGVEKGGVQAKKCLNG
jgi:NUDIX domain